MDRPKTVGQLRESGYRVLPVKEEVRKNLIARMKRGEPLFPGIYGYDETVIPQLQNAILARHDILFLGLRGQAKTRVIRMLVQLLDDAVPILAGSEVNDNPFAPISKYAKDRLEREGDRCPIEWIGRERRYGEKLATPDVTIADLLGEIDLVKHAQGRYLSDEAVLHFGLIPRTNRGIFCINELPDLSPKIQVGLFNVLEERDVQIRGFPVRLPLDVLMVFSANPEDYTNRGRIVTPLKDRIGSVIRTHYPRDLETAIRITDAHAWTERDGAIRVSVPHFMKEILEEVVALARQSSQVNQSSGVSVRMSIANREVIVSNAERRAILLGLSHAVTRVTDLPYITASSRGKVELLLAEEEDQEDRLVLKLIGEAVKKVFLQYWKLDYWRPVAEWFQGTNVFEVGDLMPAREYLAQASEISGFLDRIEAAGEKLAPELLRGPAREECIAALIEFVLEGLHVNNRLNKTVRAGRTRFRA
jgi:magnesium chelatase subunit I